MIKLTQLLYYMLNLTKKTYISAPNDVSLQIINLKSINILDKE